MSSSSTPHFEQTKTLDPQAHTDSINVIAFSEDGKFLVSGGDDGCICIFNTRDWEMVKKYRVVSPIRAIAWHPKDSKIITAGLKNGVLNTIQIKNDVKWEHNVEGSIHCISFQATGKLFAVGFSHQVLLARQASISTWSNEKYLTSPSNLVHDREDITRSVFFHSKENLVIVVYLYNGIIAYDTGSGAEKWHIDCQGLCGDSALSVSSRLLAVTNLAAGIDWYDTTTRRSIYTTPYASATELNVPLPVVFIGTNLIVAGSAEGRVTLFKSGSSQTLQILDHHDDMVQALGHFYNVHEKTHLLVTGTSERYEDCALTVWKAETMRKKSVFQLPKLGRISQYIIYGAVAGLGAVLLGRNALVITSSLYPNYLITSGQKASDKISDIWLAYKPRFGPPQTKTYTSIVTKTVELFETAISASIEHHPAEDKEDL